MLDEAKHASHWGVEFGAPTVDVDKLRAYKDGVVERLTGGTGQVAKFRKVQYVQGWASIVDPKTISVKKTGGGEETVSVDYIILALGSLPTKIPSLSLDSPRMMDSTSALELPDVPKSLLVIGGGYIGLFVDIDMRIAGLRDAAQNVREVVDGVDEDAFHARYSLGFSARITTEAAQRSLCTSVNSEPRW